MSSSHRHVFLWRSRVISFLVCLWIFLWTNRQTPWSHSVGGGRASCKRRQQRP
jgi:hypothetical protein